MESAQVLAGAGPSDPKGSEGGCIYPSAAANPEPTLSNPAHPPLKPVFGTFLPIEGLISPLIGGNRRNPLKAPSRSASLLQELLSRANPLI